jgi:hypothetical protein
MRNALSDATVRECIASAQALLAHDSKWLEISILSPVLQ